MTITISLVLTGIFLIITINLNRFVEDLRSRVELEVFLDDSFDEAKIKSLSDKIRSIAGVEDLTFISKEMAILEYNNLFKEETDYFEVLGYNPLPASFRVKLKYDFRTAQGAEQVSNAIHSLPDISPDDVAFRREALVKFEKYIRVAIGIDLIVGCIVCLSALLLVSNSIKLIIFSKSSLIHTMKLVGATNFFIRMPLYVQGTVQGILGGLFAALILLSLVKISGIEVASLITIQWQLYMLLICFGGVLGIVGSSMAVRHYL